MTTFRIKYFAPDTQRFETVEKDFEATPAGQNFIYPAISAREWADDWAYAAADKRCDYEIMEIKNVGR